LSAGLLVQAEDVSTRVEEARRDLRRVCADRLRNLTPVGDDSVNGVGHTIDHHIQQKAGCRGRWASENPGAAYLAGCVVKGGLAIAALPDVPAEYGLQNSAERAISLAGISM